MSKQKSPKVIKKTKSKQFTTVSEIFNEINELSKDKSHLDKILKHTASDQERFIHNQAKLRLRFKDKFPSFYSSKFLIYPPRINCEQSSSETTAFYKVKNIIEIISRKSEINKVLDGSCGFGLDSFEFAKYTKNVTSIDINRDLIDINNYNANIMNLNNIQFFNSNFSDFLENLIYDVNENEIQKYDLIYLDPSRRDISGNKVFKIEDLEPNVIELLSKIKKVTKFAFIKFSPLIDITYLIKTFDNLTDIFIVEYDNELKEVLILLDFVLDVEQNISESNAKMNKNINIRLTQIKDLNKIKTNQFVFDKDFNLSQSTLNYSLPLNYIYEPSVGEMKLGYWSYLFNFFKISPNTNLFTSEILDNQNENLLGKFYKIKYCGNIDKSIIEKMGITKANIKVRNSALSIDEAYKKLGIKNGGEEYIFLIKDLNNKNIMIICEKF